MESKTAWLIGIGATILVGGGIAAYLYSRKSEEDSATNPDGTKKETKADGETKPTDTATKPTDTATKPEELVDGESDDIQYIVEGGSGGGAHAGMILVKLVSGAVATGDMVHIVHPNYEGQYKVVDNNDTYGGSIIYLDTPFIDKGTTSTSTDTYKTDYQKGTVAVMGVPASGFSGFAGKAILPNIRYIKKAEAGVRKKAQSEAKSKGLKGVPLRNFIRAAAEKARKEEEAKAVAAAFALSHKPATPAVAKIAKSFGLKPDQWGRYNPSTLSPSDKIKFNAALNKIGIIASGQGRGVDGSYSSCLGDTTNSDLLDL